MYALLSDLHFHKWTSFLPPHSGINPRLQIIIDEALRANTELREAGGNLMVLAGDIFHVRGKISPEVLNPVLECFRQIIATGTRVVGISGNHDLESDSATDLSSAATSLRSVGVEIFNKPTFINHEGANFLFIPYIDKIAALKEEIANAVDSIGEEEAAKHDLIIHAPVDGVIDGLPDHGLSPEWLADAGFKRVLCGHYHNHRAFEGNVYSIGATTHQTWSDVGSKAGFLLVGEDTNEVNWRASRAPKFIHIPEEMELDEVPLVADGNYVRVKLEYEKETEVVKLREYLVECGAKGVLINKLKKTAAISRTGATVSSGASLEVSVGEYIKHKEYDNQEELATLCGSILSKVESEE